MLNLLFRSARQGAVSAVVAFGLMIPGTLGLARADLIPGPVGDFLDTYTGLHDAGLDVVAHEVLLQGDRVIFFGRMAGPIAPTQAIGGLNLFGVDRGRGTPRFLINAAERGNEFTASVPLSVLLPEAELEPALTVGAFEGTISTPRR